MRRLTVGAEAFDVTLLEAEAPSRVVLFAVGRGGDPGRHLPLLTALAERGLTVVAPHFERLASVRPTVDELSLRGRRLRAALDAVARPGVAAVGVGHSIGATVLLGLAGGQVWMGEGRPLELPVDPRLERLVLLAPATGFFQAPGALDGVRARVQLWAGGADEHCPPAAVLAVGQALAPSAEVRVAAGAGHFSFMDAPPPNTVEPLPDREAFLAGLRAEVGRFIAG